MFTHIIRLIVISLCCGAVVAAPAGEGAFHFDYDQSDQTSATAIGAAKRLGAAQASADIAAGRFQIIQYGEPVDPPVPPVVPRDPSTGYSILSLHDCVPTPAFEAHVRAYNEAMRSWHSEHGTKTSNQAMQLTASKPAVYAWGVCPRQLMLRFMHRGLAAADLVAR